MRNDRLEALRMDLFSMDTVTLTIVAIPHTQFLMTKPEFLPAAKRHGHAEL